MRHALLIAVLAAVLGLGTTPLAAQAFPGGYLAVGENGYFYRVDPNLTVASLRIDAGGLSGLVIDLDNRTALVGVPGTGSVLRVDPDRLAIVGTLATGLGQPAGMAMDPNGRLLVADTQGGRLFKVSPDGGVSTILIAPSLLRSPRGGLLASVFSTDLVLQDTDPAHGAPLLRMRRDGTHVTTLSTGQKPGLGLAEHILTGDYYVGSADTSNAAIYRLPSGAAGAAAWLAPTSTLVGAASLAAERASAPIQRLLVGAYHSSPQSRGLYSVDLQSQTITKLADLPTTLTGVAFARSRVLAAIRTERGRWTLRVNFPDFPDRQYILLPSLHGLHTSERLPDGRRICLIPDLVTQILVYLGDIGPFTRGFRGGLDASGAAAAALDLSMLGPWADGLVVWIAPVAIDRKHYLGLGAIGDPIALELE
ncbi:MAG: hypothetical protein JXQ29_02930 [Planctomycetes bacterium]|nr:hypothetical protein [Planctomycetota bacterium]